MYFILIKLLLDIPLTAVIEQLVFLMLMLLHSATRNICARSCAPKHQFTQNRNFTQDPFGIRHRCVKPKSFRIKSKNTFTSTYKLRFENFIQQHSIECGLSNQAVWDKLSRLKWTKPVCESRGKAKICQSISNKKYALNRKIKKSTVNLSPTKSPNFKNKLKPSTIVGESQHCQLSSVTLIYFPVHGDSGRGLSVRLCAILGEIQFEDVMLPKSIHLEQKQNHQRRWLGLPEMVIYTKNGDSQRIAQSNACLRYLGSIGGLYPMHNPLKAALIDEVMDSVENVITEGLMTIRLIRDSEDNQDRKRVIRQLMSGQKENYGTLRMWFDRFECRLKENEKKGNGKGFFVGNTLSIADLKVFAHFRNYGNGVFEEMYGVPQSIFEDNGYQRISEFVRMMSQLPRISAFIKEYEDRIRCFPMNEKDRTFSQGIRVYPGKLILDQIPT